MCLVRPTRQITSGTCVLGIRNYRANENSTAPPMRLGISSRLIWKEGLASVWVRFLEANLEERKQENGRRLLI
jgi:hypothetical protein